MPSISEQLNKAYEEDLTQGLRQATCLRPPTQLEVMKKERERLISQLSKVERMINLIEAHSQVAEYVKLFEERDY